MATPTPTPAVIVHLNQQHSSPPPKHFLIVASSAFVIALSLLLLRRSLINLTLRLVYRRRTKKQLASTKHRLITLIKSSHSAIEMAQSTADVKAAMSDGIFMTMSS